MLRRAELVEHPFGTLKCRAGYRHFLVRGFDKVRGEWSLMALCYNLCRVLNILRFDALVAYYRQRAVNRHFCLFYAPSQRLSGRSQRFPSAYWSLDGHKFKVGSDTTSSRMK